MVNRMVFFYVYVIAERFTSDFWGIPSPRVIFPHRAQKQADDT